MARPIWHALSAAPISLAAYATLGPVPAAAAAAGALLIDVDHLVDWTLNGGREDYRHRIVVPLHAWEIPIGLLAAGAAGGIAARWRRPLRALAAGWAAHLLLDFLVNRPETPASYLLLKRLANRFGRVPSGWLPEEEWLTRRGPPRRAAPAEALLAGALGMALLVAADR